MIQLPFARDAWSYGLPPLVAVGWSVQLLNLRHWAFLAKRPTSGIALQLWHPVCELCHKVQLHLTMLRALERSRSPSMTDE